MSALPTGPTANTRAIASRMPYKAPDVPRTANDLTAPSFGSLLRTYRERAGLNRVALSRRAGRGRDCVARLERGDTGPREGTAMALADALGLDDGERAAFVAMAWGGVPVRLRRAVPTLPPFGAVLRRYREREGLSIVELGRQAGLGKGHLVWRLEHGDRLPSRHSAEMLAGGLGLNDGERAVLLLSAGFVPPDLADAVALPAIRRVVRTLGNLEGEARDQCAADLSAVCRRWARAPRHPALVEG